MDAAVELAVKLGDWYTAGMILVPLSLLGLAIKFGLKAKEQGAEPAAGIFAAGLTLAAVATAFVAVPAYFDARELCQELTAAADDTSDAHSSWDPTTGNITLKSDPDFVALLRSNCPQVARIPL
jgi:hypothetical protein